MPIFFFVTHVLIFSYGWFNKKKYNHAWDTCDILVFYELEITVKERIDCTKTRFENLERNWNNIGFGEIWIV